MPRRRGGGWAGDAASIPLLPARLMREMTGRPSILIELATARPEREPAISIAANPYSAAVHLAEGRPSQFVAIANGLRESTASRRPAIHDVESRRPVFLNHGGFSGPRRPFVEGRSARSPSQRVYEARDRSPLGNAASPSLGPNRSLCPPARQLSDSTLRHRRAAGRARN